MLVWDWFSSEMPCMTLCPLLDLNLLLACLVWLRCMPLGHVPSTSLLWVSMASVICLWSHSWGYFNEYFTLALEITFPMMNWAKHYFASLRNKLQWSNHAWCCMFIKHCWYPVQNANLRWFMISWLICSFYLLSCGLLLLALLLLVQLLTPALLLLGDSLSCTS
jgi:hypothetical protein